MSYKFYISDYSVTPLTADSDDFEMQGSTVDFDDGDAQQMVVILIKSDDKDEGPELFAVNLHYPPEADPTVCRGKIGEPSTAYVTIHDHDTSKWLLIERDRKSLYSRKKTTTNKNTLVCYRKSVWA